MEVLNVTFISVSVIWQQMEQLVIREETVLQLINANVNKDTMALLAPQRYNAIISLSTTLLKYVVDMVSAQLQILACAMKNTLERFVTN